MRDEGKMSIRKKLVVAIVASMLALALVTGALVRAAAERNATIVAEQAVAVAAQALDAAERSDVEKLDATLRALGAHPEIADAFAKRDRARLLALAAPLFALLRDEHDVTHLYFIEPEPSRAVFLRVHRPEQFGDVVDRATLATAIRTKRLGAGKELGKSAFALRAVRPMYDGGGRLLGYIELAEEIDHLLRRIKAQTGDDYALVVDKAFLDARAWAGTARGQRAGWDDHARTVVIDTTSADEGIVDLDRGLDAIPARGLLLDRRVRGGTTVVRGIVPVNDAAGRRVGGLFVVHDVGGIHRSMLAARRGIYGALLAVAAVLGALLVFLVNRLVFRRLDAMIATMEDLSRRLAGGDYDVVAPRASARDEIGRFEELFGRFVRVVAKLLQDLGRDRAR